LGQAILSVATDLGSFADDPKNIIIAAIGEMDNLEAVVSVLSDILGGSVDPDADPNNLAMAAIVIIAAAAKDSGNPNTYFPPGSPPPLAVALANAAKNNPDAGDTLKDILGKLGL